MDRLQNFSNGLQELDVAPQGGAIRFVLDGVLIVSGWVLLVGVTTYPEAQLAGILGCAIALLAPRRQRRS